MSTRNESATTDDRVATMESKQVVNGETLGGNAFNGETVIGLYEGLKTTEN